MTTTNTTLPDWWIETTLGEVCEFISRWVTPKYSNEWILVYNQKCIRDWKILKKDSRFLDSSQKIMEEKFLKDLDILICSTWVWTLWRVWQIKEVIIPSTVDSHVSIVRVNNKNSKFYIWYLLKSREKYIESLAEWSTWQTELPREKIKNISLFLPPLPEQQAIAKILSSFDDKIELLREQNETLEKMAQTIFEEWFGKYSVDDELPEGWRVGKLGEVIENYDSKRIPIASDKRKKWIYPYYGATWINDFVNGYIFDWIYTLLWEDGSVIKENWKPFTQYVWWKIWVNNHAHVLQWKNWFSTELIKIILDNTDIFPFVNWAVQLKINQTNMNSIPLIIPTKEILKEFDDLIQPVFWKIRDNSEEIQTLSKTRDELLPKLMKGEVRVV